MDAGGNRLKHHRVNNRLENMDAPIIESPATQNKKNVNMSSASKTINSSLGDAVDSAGMVIFMFYFLVSFFFARQCLRSLYFFFHFFDFFLSISPSSFSSSDSLSK